MVDGHQRIQRKQDFFVQTCSGSQCRNTETMHCLTSHWKSVLDKGGLYYYLVSIVTIKIICAALFVIRGFFLKEKNDNGEDNF